MSDPTDAHPSFGEFDLIDRIAASLPPSRSPTGIGDDAAVIDIPGDDYLLATVDMLVEGVHFRLGRTDISDVGRRAIAVNVSDIAAMGGTPGQALVSIAVDGARTELIPALYQGLAQEAARYGLEIVGGNLSRTSGPLCIDITILGRVDKHQVVKRGGARQGDLLAVTGSLGDATAARLAVERGVPLAERLSEWVLDHLVPDARLAAGRLLATSGAVHAMMDLSDGLSSDIQHLCGASQVGALIYERALPIAAETVTLANELALEPVDLALSGGEDYELLLALPAEELKDLRTRVAPLALTEVGEIVQATEGVTLAREDGRRVPLTTTGWRHF